MTEPPLVVPIITVMSGRVARMAKAALDAAISEGAEVSPAEMEQVGLAVIRAAAYRSYLELEGRLPAPLRERRGGGP